MKVIISNEEQFDDQGSNITFGLDPQKLQIEYNVFKLTKTLEQSLKRKHQNQFRNILNKTSLSLYRDSYNKAENLFFTCLFKEMGVILKLQKKDLLVHTSLFDVSREALSETIDEIFPEVDNQSIHYEELVTLGEHGIVAGAEVMLDLFHDLKDRENKIFEGSENNECFN
jgi:hypothetical protein